MKNKTQKKQILKEITKLRVEIAEKSDRLKELQDKLKTIYENERPITQEDNMKYWLIMTNEVTNFTIIECEEKPIMMEITKTEYDNKKDWLKRNNYILRNGKKHIEV